MISINSLCEKVLNVKGLVVLNTEVHEDENKVKHLIIKVRPVKWEENRCPICNKKCPGYDKVSNNPKVWRGLDWNGILVEIECNIHRICCKEHGVVTMNVPWAYSNSNFTKAFDLNVAWLARNISKSAVAEYMRIDWATVGRCVSRTRNDLEPDILKRLDGLKRIGIDETSYKKGHKYITTVVNLDTNEVVWAHENHGKTVLEQFYKLLTPEQLSSIEAVAADGARWITDCVNQYTPNCERCIDPFHVVEWATEALDSVRTEAWREAQTKVKELKKENPRGKGRPKKGDENSDKISEAIKIASEIKNSSYALEKAPENLTENQKQKLNIVANNNRKLYRAYQLKEELRMLLKISDVDEAEEALKSWLWRTSHSRINSIKELSEKIRRHKDHILNTIKLKLNSAKVESMNNQIKLIIRRSFGFRNIQNMLDMIYLCCSNLNIPLPNRKQKLPECI